MRRLHLHPFLVLEAGSVRRLLVAAGQRARGSAAMLPKNAARIKCYLLLLVHSQFAMCFPHFATKISCY
uniref:Uncharacterized protein n=1 Tax=Oryza glumipatula TaxID=40148 RepID=A0A0E0BM53_9ORYZ